MSKYYTKEELRRLLSPTEDKSVTPIASATIARLAGELLEATQDLHMVAKNGTKELSSLKKVCQVVVDDLHTTIHHKKMNRYAIIQNYLRVMNQCEGMLKKELKAAEFEDDLKKTDGKWNGEQKAKKLIVDSA